MITFYDPLAIAVAATSFALLKSPLSILLSIISIYSLSLLLKLLLFLSFLPVNIFDKDENNVGIYEITVNNLLEFSFIFGYDGLSYGDM